MSAGEMQLERLGLPQCQVHPSMQNFQRLSGECPSDSSTSGGFTLARADKMESKPNADQAHLRSVHQSSLSLWKACVLPCKWITLGGRQVVETHA